MRHGKGKCLPIQAAHNMTKPTASLPRQLVHHKWSATSPMRVTFHIPGSPQRCASMVVTHDPGMRSLSPTTSSTRFGRFGTWLTRMPLVRPPLSLSCLSLSRYHTASSLASTATRQIGPAWSLP